MKNMKKIISASRRTDMVAFFPQWLSSAIASEKAKVYGPSGHTYTVDLRPQSVHTFVLWSKNFANLIDNAYGLRDELNKYDQLYLHFTITGLGGSFVERGVPHFDVALSQLDALIAIAGKPRRVSVRFDPIIYWKEGEEEKTNLHFFERMAPVLKDKEIQDIRISFAQWYNKAKKRATKKRFDYLDPPIEQKIKDAKTVHEIAKDFGLNLYACSQAFLTEKAAIPPSSCIHGPLLQALHPQKAPVSVKEDRTQRKDCHCTESVDIGSYTQFCPHSCIYCYANPKL